MGFVGLPVGRGLVWRLICLDSAVCCGVGIIQVLLGDVGLGGFGFGFWGWFGWFLALLEFLGFGVLVLFGAERGMGLFGGAVAWVGGFGFLVLPDFCFRVWMLRLCFLGCGLLRLGGFCWVD